MIILVATLSIALFMIALHFTGIIRVAAGILPVVRASLSTINDAQLDDDKKEQAIQAASLFLAKSFFSILLRSLLTLAISALPILGAHYAGLVELDASTAFLSRWDVILVATAIIVIGYIVGTRLWRSK